MSESDVAQATGISSARCATHPDVAASGVCTRCGDYHCAACQKAIGGRSLCATCRALPGIDYLEETRLRFWGKRDGYVWYYGVFVALSQLLTLARGTGTTDAIVLGDSAVSVVTSIAYMLLWRPARALLVVAHAVGALIAVGRLLLLGPDLMKTMGPAGARSFDAIGGFSSVAWLVVASALLSVLLALAAYHSPRNKLAFKIEIDERALQRVYDTYVSNSLALRAAWYSLFGFVPFASAVTLVMGLVALKRTDKARWPPRGGRVPATIAIIASSLCLLGWIGVIAWSAARTVKHGN